MVPDTEPIVSVVLPTYNAEPHLSEALDSLLQQTFDAFEILIVDDGSTDGTVETAREYATADSRIRVIQRDRSTGGLPGALNEGIRQARGTYIARQDADDVSVNIRLAKQVEFLEANPTVALVGTAVRFIDEAGSQTGVRYPPSDPTFDDIYAKNRFIHGSVMFRRAPVEALGGYDETFEYSEDYDLWLRLSADHPVRNILEPLYELRMHDESIYGSQLRSVKLHSWFARKRVTGQLSSTLPEIGGIEGVRALLSDAEVATLNTELAQENLRYDRHTDARRAALSGLRRSPKRPMLWGLLLLSFLPHALVEKVISTYRRYLNRTGS